METLLEILNDLHPEVDFEEEESLLDDKILDSFDIISIIAEINEQYDIAVSAEDIIPANFNSAKAIYEMIERLQENAWKAEAESVWALSFLLPRIACVLMLKML